VTVASPSPSCKPSLCLPPAAVDTVALMSPPAVSRGVPPTGTIQAGDAYTTDGRMIALTEAVGDAHDTVDGGTGGDIHARCHELAGEAGDDVAVGDVFAAEGGSVALGASAGAGSSIDGDTVPAGHGGDDNRLLAFADDVRGFGGDDRIVGDVMVSGTGSTTLNAEAGRGGVSCLAAGGSAGRHNTVTAFTDRLSGGTGRDTLAGDVLQLSGAGTIELAAIAGRGADGGWQIGAGDGGDDNTVDGFNDTLDGGGDDDILAGDVAADGSSGVVRLVSSTSAGGSGYTNGDGGHRDLVHAFSDRLAGGAGNDALVGDVLRAVAHDRVELLTAAGGGGAGYGTVHGSAGGKGGNEAVARAHTDTLNGGIGDDWMVGDVEHRTSVGDVALSVGAGSGADGGGGGGDGGDGGTRNIAHAFDDNLSGEDGADLLVGDALLADDEGDVTLTASAGVGGYGVEDAGGGVGGDGNVVFGFGDELQGGGGNDLLVGDLASDSTTGRIELSALAGQGGGGDTAGGHGGDDNWVGAFNDRLDGGDGDDLLIGDLSVERFVAGPQGGIRLLVASGTAGSYTSDNGGSGNSVRAFNDTLDGGDGDDLLIGDVRYVFDTPAQGDHLVLDIQGGGDDRATAFCDVLTGGDGNDTLYGDCFDGSASISPQVWSQPEKGRLFADTLDGGAGDDVLIGGLGADVMTGGGGDDVFRWDLDDLWETPVPGVDRITDFAEGDVLDLRPFFTAFTYPPGYEPDASFLRLRTDGADTLLDYSLTGGPLYEPFLRLENYTTDATIQELLDDGVILIEDPLLA